MKQKQRILGNKVDAMSSENIMQKASEARAEIKRFLQDDNPCIDLLEFLEKCHNCYYIQLEVTDLQKMPNEYALTYPGEKIIILRQDTYDQACTGNPRSRFTIAHELGHLILHANTVPHFAFSQTPSNHSYQEDVEWQANEFAGWLMVDPCYTDLLKNPKVCSDGFGVSMETAGHMLEKIRKVKKYQR